MAKIEKMKDGIIGVEKNWIIKDRSKLLMVVVVPIALIMITGGYLQFFYFNQLDKTNDQSITVLPVVEEKIDLHGVTYYRWADYEPLINGESIRKYFVYDNMVRFIWMTVWAYHNMYNFTYTIVYNGVEYGNMSITFLPIEEDPNFIVFAVKLTYHGEVGVLKRMKIGDDGYNPPATLPGLATSFIDIRGLLDNYTARKSVVSLDTGEVANYTTEIEEKDRVWANDSGNAAYLVTHWNNLTYDIINPTANMQIYTKIKVDTDLNVYLTNQFVHYPLPIKIDLFLYDAVKKNS